MSAIIRPVLNRKALTYASLSSLILMFSLACGPAASPVTPDPKVSTSTPVADGIGQTTTEAATPTPSRALEATAVRTGNTQGTVKDSKDTSESFPRSGGAGEAAFDPQDGGNDSDNSDGQAPSPLSDGTSEDNQAPAIPDKGELKYPNLGSRLDQLVASVEAGETRAEQAASGAAIHSGASVAVTFYLSGGVDEVVAFLEENGGDPRNVGEDYIEAYVPVTLLGPASEQPGVLRVREIVPPEQGRGR